MSEAVLECRGIHKTFFDGSRKLHILRGVNLAAQPGRILAISGQSGTGKSTLLHIMGTLDTPTEGTVLFRGVDVFRQNGGFLNRLRNRDIGFVFQFYHLLPEFSALENVMVPGLSKGRGRASCRARAEELLDKVGLTERLTHKPGQLSGGEQQRVAIARALFNEPGVVLADEPTGNLDEGTGAGIVDLLWRLNADDGVTIVLVTHDLELARRAHTWAVLHEGVVELQAAP
jgi:lipoprotein-releasing system ATP-binding protein